MDPELPLHDVAPARAPDDRAPARHRSQPQRVLLAAGALLTVLAVVAAAVVGWGAWKLRSIDRTDVALDERIADGPANYLVVGSDSRQGGDPLDPEAGDDHAPLADTIMLIRIDPAERTAKVLSLPRDLWVTLPATGEKGRVNAAYAAGPQELIDTLRAELDVPINHYVEVDFRGFQEIVSSVDGVPMWFDRAMRDRNTGLEVLHPGCVTLDGRAALAFARSRHLQYFEDGGFTADGTGDLGRISRQQLFLRRVIDRAKTKGLSNPLTLKQLIDAGTANVTIDDDLSVGDLVALGKRFQAFDSDALQTFTLPNTPRTTDGGAQIVELDAAAAEPVLGQFRDVVPAADQPVDAGTTTGVPLLDPGTIEATVLNSSGRQGLAVEVADDLVAAGFQVARYGNGEELGHELEAASVVRHAPGAAEAARTVAARVPTATIEEDDTLDGGAVVLYLGEDFTALVEPDAAAGPKTMTTAADGTVAADDDDTDLGGTTTTDEPDPSKAVGIMPGDPPEGRSCG